MFEVSLSFTEQLCGCSSLQIRNYSGIIATTEQGSLNAKEIIGSWGDRGQAIAFICQTQGGHGYHNGQQSENSNHSSLTHRGLWHLLVNHGASGRETDGCRLNSYLN